MGMFLNYQNIADNYKPNNLMCSFPVGKSYTKLDPVEASKPFEEYNARGELVGYFWHYGETVHLEFNIDGEITVESDAIIYAASCDYPTIETEGYIGQKAYNIVDFISWTCVGIVEGNYIWKEDCEFTYDPTSSSSIYVSAREYLADKRVEFTLYNFRQEPIYKKTYGGTTNIVVTIDKELSNKLHKGIYYCSLTVIGDNVVTPVFTSKDCTLLVK